LLPFDKFAVANGEIVWEDLGASLNYLPATDVNLQWSTFENLSGVKTHITGATSKKIPAASTQYSCLTLQDKQKPAHVIDVFLRHEGAATRIVGVDRHW